MGGGIAAYIVYLKITHSRTQPKHICSSIGRMGGMVEIEDTPMREYNYHRRPYGDREWRSGSLASNGPFFFSSAWLSPPIWSTCRSGKRTRSASAIALLTCEDEPGGQNALSALLIFAISEIARRNQFAGSVLASIPLVSVLAMIWLYRDTRDVAKGGAVSRGMCSGW